MGFTREGVLRPYEAGLRPLREPPICSAAPFVISPDGCVQIS